MADPHFGDKSLRAKPSAQLSLKKIGLLWLVRKAGLRKRFDKIATNAKMAFGKLIDANTCHIPQGYVDFAFNKRTGRGASRFSLECQTLLVNEFKRRTQVVDGLEYQEYWAALLVLARLRGFAAKKIIFVT